MDTHLPYSIDKFFVKAIGINPSHMRRGRFPMTGRQIRGNYRIPVVVVVEYSRFNENIWSMDFAKARRDIPLNTPPYKPNYSKHTGQCQNYHERRTESGKAGL